jgi:hypothetical protein
MVYIAGKSIVLRVIAGLITPSAGLIFSSVSESCAPLLGDNRYCGCGRPSIFMPGRMPLASNQQVFISSA